MATPVQLPALSPTMKEGKISKWLKKEGDKIASGEAIAECETDKANLEIEAYDDGYLLKILVPAGQTAPVGAPIAMIGAKGEQVTAPPPAAPAPAPAKEQPHPAQERMEIPPPPPQPAARPAAASKGAAPAGQVVPLRRPEPATGGGGRMRVSPLARKMAREEGLDLGALQGSGPQGRIVKRDIEAAMNGGEARARRAPRAPVVLGARPEPTATEISSMRKVIAQRMGEVKPGVPHFYLTVDVEMDQAMKLKEQAKSDELRISVNDLIVKAAAVALKRYPRANVSLQGDRVLQFGTADISIAVAIEDGLITPVIRDADLKPLSAIGEEARQLAERARKRALKPEEYTGGSLTVSNLGMYGIDEFIAVINPPQAMILAVGAVTDRAVVRDGQVVARKMMTVTLSGDHRVIDGATGAEYLRELKPLLENPMRLLF